MEAVVKSCLADKVPTDTRASPARLLLGDYLAIFADDDEADVACDFEQTYKCAGKSFYDFTRREVLPMVRSILLLCFTGFVWSWC